MQKWSATLHVGVGPRGIPTTSSPLARRCALRRTEPHPNPAALLPTMPEEDRGPPWIDPPPFAIARFTAVLDLRAAMDRCRELERRAPRPLLLTAVGDVPHARIHLDLEQMASSCRSSGQTRPHRPSSSFAVSIQICVAAGAGCALPPDLVEGGREGKARRSPASSLARRPPRSSSPLP
ncbi:unnamed protein product [Urochloa humidicola]